MAILWTGFESVIGQPPLGYQATPEAIERAKAIAAEERAAVDAEVKAAELERHAAIQVLTDLIDQYGLDTIRRWFRNIAAGMGQSL